MSLKSLADWARLPSSDRSVANVWINDDIRPLPPSRRTWTTLTYISFWLTNQIASTQSPAAETAAMKPRGHEAPHYPPLPQRWGLRLTRRTD